MPHFQFFTNGQPEKIQCYQAKCPIIYSLGKIFESLNFTNLLNPRNLSTLNKTVLPHMRILAHTRMGYPVRVWANIMSHTRMGVPYEHACMVVHSCTTCTPGINFCLLTKY